MKPSPVCPLTRLAPEVLLEIGQWTVCVEREHRRRDDHRGDVRPHEPRPAPCQKPADEEEGDERGVQDRNEVGRACVQHRRLHARRSVPWTA
jgi:hypothetical protein